MVARHHDHANARRATRCERLGDAFAHRVLEGEQPREAEFAVWLAPRPLARVELARSAGDHLVALRGERVDRGAPRGARSDLQEALREHRLRSALHRREQGAVLAQDARFPLAVLGERKARLDAPGQRRAERVVQRDVHRVAGLAPRRGRGEQ
jgi:hypothetical protein